MLVLVEEDEYYPIYSFYKPGDPAAPSSLVERFHIDPDLISRYNCIKQQLDAITIEMDEALSKERKDEA